MVSEEIKKTLFVLLCCVGVAAFIATILLNISTSITECKKGVKMGEYNVTQLKTEEGWQRAVTIPELRFLELEEAEAMLNKLYAAGVDNWDGYDDAVAED